VPEDVMAGGPLGYRRVEGKERYRIWTSAWDGVDDGGLRNLDRENPERTKFQKEDYVGDWVWSYAPEKEAK